jgi:hypothetical protein
VLFDVAATREGELSLGAGGRNENVRKREGSSQLHRTIK